MYIQREASRDKGFEKEFNESYDYPVILERRSGENRVVLSREEISEIKTIDDFVDRIVVAIFCRACLASFGVVLLLFSKTYT